MRRWCCLLIVLFLSCTVSSFAQEVSQDSTIPFSEKKLPDTISLKKVKDTSHKFLVKRFSAPIIDSSGRIPDSLKYKIATSPIVKKSDSSFYVNIFAGNGFLHRKNDAISYLIAERNTSMDKEIIFYIILCFLLLIGMFRVFYSKYLTNVFRVFFNTSLRKGQLTDILLQSRLSSLIFNIIFVISAGLYLWIIFLHFGIISRYKFLFLPVCIILILAVYIIKYVAIKFIGWLSGLQDAANQYIFIIFLINKILSFLLLPFVIIIAFGPPQWLHLVIIFSWLILLSLFAVRYIRTYGNLQPYLHVSPLHFFIYLSAAEILPLLILYKSIFPILTFISGHSMDISL